MAKSATGRVAQTTCTYHDIHEPNDGNHAPVEFAQECLFQAVSRQSRQVAIFAYLFFGTSRLIWLNFLDSGVHSSHGELFVHCAWLGVVW
jgi:hypothetical protein